jgi:SAM-dependent methyltransferase
VSTSAEYRIDERYLSGDYLEKNPTFHVERAEFKAGLVSGILQQHQIDARRICDVGCGAGEVLSLLAASWRPGAEFHGYELSPQGFELCRRRENENVSFFHRNLFDTDEQYDLALCLDVFEHVEDPFSFLRSLRSHAEKFVFHIPLDMNAQMVLRGSPIMHVRRKLGHLHYFSRDSALALLKETGYVIVDHQYTPSAIYRPKSMAARIASVPRQIAKRLLGDLGVRLTGGYSLLVLAE